MRKLNGMLSAPPPELDRVIINSHSSEPGYGADLLVQYIQHLLNEKGLKGIPEW